MSDGINVAFGINLRKAILGITGLWPKEHPTLYDKIAREISLTISTMLIAIMIAGLFKLSGDYVLLTEQISVLISPLSFIIKMILFRRKGSGFSALNDKLSKGVFNKHLSHVKVFIKKSTETCLRIGNMYQVVCSTVLVLYCVRPVVDGELPVRFHYEMGPYKHVMYFFQLLCLCNSTLTNSSFDVLGMYFMGRAADQIDVLNQAITNLKMYGDSKQTGSNNYIPHLRKCVKQHNEIIRFIDNIEEVFSYIFLVQYLTSAAVICTIGFQLVHVHPLSLQFANSFLYFTTMICQLGMYCWFGNEIIVKSTDTKRACYESDWMNCDLRVRKMLIIISEPSQRPLCLTAGKFSVLSLSSFTTVINTSYSYFALMQNLYAKQD